MAILFDKEKQIFTLQTANTTYQMQVDQYGVLLHLYYGAKILGDTAYTIVHKDRGLSGNIYDAGEDRCYSLDTLPQEYPGIGTGDFRSSALMIKNSDGSECCDLRYVDFQITRGKYALKGLPAVYASEEEAETLSITLEDKSTKVQVKLLYNTRCRYELYIYLHSLTGIMHLLIRLYYILWIGRLNRHLSLPS